MKTRNKVIATGMSVALAFTMTPVVALADDQAAQESLDYGVSAADAAASFEAPSVESAASDWIPVGGYDKADFYSESEDDEVALLSDSARAASVYPVKDSKDMLYFGAFEGGTYDRTFSWGDGYHALGFYQFDHRYGLQNFLIACYNYNPKKYAMFKQFLAIPAAEFKAANAIRQKNEEGVEEFTELGKALNEAWVAAANADGKGVAVADSEFARLQDGWAYESYYMPAERYLASRGIDISDRNDAVKGLCWGMSNLFGNTGWRKFVGGISDGYDWDGIYHYLSEKYVWPGAGLRDDMSDREFVSVLCDYVVDNVAVFYKGQPQYHKGWQNRYKREKAQCLAIIDRTGDTHEPKPEPEPEPQPQPQPDPQPQPGPDNSGSDAWYTPYIAEAKRLGLMQGFPDGDFRPEEPVTRAQVAMVFCRAQGADTGSRPSNQTPWDDVLGGEWYTEAMNWAYKNKIFTGDNGGTSTVRPDDTITREEMAKVVASYMERFRGAHVDASGLNWPNGASNTHDIEKLSSWAVPYFKWLANEGVMGGIVNPDGSVSLDPQGTATRAMFCKVSVDASKW